jgi:hypothetical protein
MHELHYGVSAYAQNQADGAAIVRSANGKHKIIDK